MIEECNEAEAISDGYYLTDGYYWNNSSTLMLRWCIGENIQIWNANTGQLVSTFPSDASIKGVIWSEDEVLILNRKNQLQLWDAVSAKMVQEFQVAPPGDSIKLLQWGTQSNYILMSGTIAEEEKIWDAVTGNAMLEVSNAHVSYANNRVLSWNNGGNMGYVWNLSHTPPPLLPPTKLGRPLEQIRWAPEQDKFLSWGADLQVDGWDVQTGKQLFSLLHEQTIVDASWSSNANRILTRTKDNIVRIWDGKNGQLLQNLSVLGLSGHGKIDVAEINPDGSQVLVWWSLGTHELWDINNKQSLWKFEESAPMWLAIWSHDSSHILTSSTHSQAIIMWDAATGKLIRSFSDCCITASRLGARWSKDDSLVLIWGGSSTTASLWNSIDGKQRFALADNTWSAQWDANEARILTVSGNSWQIWEATQGKLLLTVSDVGSSRYAQWSHNNSLIFSRNSDGVIKIWNASTGQLLRIISTGRTDIVDAIWSDDDSQIISIFKSGEIHHIYLEKEDILRAACERATRNLTWTEWQQFLVGDLHEQTCPNLPTHPSVPAESVNGSK